MEGIVHGFETVFGTQDDVNAGQMVLRAIVVYLAALAMVRIGDKRFLGEIAAFDFLLAIIIGSIVSRAISGNAPFWPSVAAAFALVLLHHAFGKLGFRFDRFAGIVKGQTRILVRDGAVQWDVMRKAAIGEEDLRSAIRRKGGIAEIQEVALACLERNGEISVLRREG